MDDADFSSRLSEILQDGLVDGDRTPYDESPVLKGFYVIGEFETVEGGSQGLLCFAGTPFGASPAPWTVKGWLNEALDEGYLGVARED